MGAPLPVRGRAVTGGRDGRAMQTHRLFTTTGSVLAIAAIAAGPAAAHPGDRISPDALDAGAGRYLGSGAPDVRSLGSAGPDRRSPDARDAATRVPVVIHWAAAPAAPDSGLSWDSAAIGALAGTGLLVSLAGGGLLVVRRRGRVARPAA
jgi:hypothetical protein